ncbi:TCR/Tet family MFS transporter [Sphingomonas jaspsi]|uniref:TCR/Tet family MFS transporter n=1 Tax=Sphingomonas jaspsi TaxID=392409 RepID=UPI0004B084FA|nr:tetracycline resistance MFS efflux pump [Sphingomonas jaspsi]
MNSTAARIPHAAPFILVTVLIDAIGFGIIIPTLPRLIMEVGHIDLPRATQIGGWLALLYAVVQFVAGPTVGNLSDRFGRRPVLLGALAGYAIDYALLTIANSLPLFFLGRALAGLFGATYGPCQAALADITPPAQRARVFGLVGASFGIGFVVGPAIGGLLGEFGHRIPFAAAALLAGLNFLYGLFVFPETLKSELRRPFNWRRANPLGAIAVVRSIPGLPWVVVTYFVWQIASLVYPSVWSYYTIANFGWSSGRIGASLAAVGIAMAFCQFFLTGRMVARFGERRTAQIGLVGATCGFAGYMLIDSGTIALMFIVIIAIQSLVQPSLSAMLSQRVPADAQGEVQGIGGSVMALGAVFAPLLYNPALAYFTGDSAPFRWPGAPFAIAVVFALITMVTLAKTPRRRAA